MTALDGSVGRAALTLLLVGTLPAAAEITAVSFKTSRNIGFL